MMNSSLRFKNLYLIFFIIFFSLIDPNQSVTIEITNENLQEILSSNEFVLIYFYVRWCRFSEEIHPIIDQLANEIHRKYFNKRNVTVGKVDCDQYPSIGEKYRIKKYPTIKFFRHGLMIKNEYRSKRDFPSLLKYFDAQLVPSLIRFNSRKILDEKFDRKKIYLVGYFHNDRSRNFLVFEKISEILRDQCSFVCLIDENLTEEKIFSRLNEENQVKTIVYRGNFSNEDELYFWSSNQCLSIIREITFENAEELTDEEFPFLILFHRQNDSNSLKIFQNQIEHQLHHFNSQLTILHGQGEQYLHPLKYFHKNISDLPLILFDDFHRMFLFYPFERIQIKGQLFQFVAKCLEKNLQSKNFSSNDLSSVPSVFVHLTASRRRYSFRDEL